MADELDDTYGGPNADTYISIADADALIRAECDPAAWERARGVPNGQRRALRQAVRDIKAAGPWRDARYFRDQALEFPRGTLVGDLGIVGQPDATFVALCESDPYLRQQRRAVREAACLQALFVLREGTDIVRQEQFQGITGSSRGIRAVDSQSYGGIHLVLCPDAWSLLAEYAGEPILKRGTATY